MELGEKIRQARLEAGLSQRQLCGEEITRNMLSQIENGSARPSMDTLRYLAGRLEKSVAYFLEEQAVTSPNQSVMEQARESWSKGDPEQTARYLSAYRGPDPVFDRERWLLEALCLVDMAEQALEEGRGGYAATLLEKAQKAGQQTDYCTPDLERRRQLLACRADPAGAQRTVEALPDLTPELLVRARAAMDDGDPERSGRILDAAAPTEDRQWHYLRAEAYFAMKAYAPAAEHYHRAEALYPRQTAVRLEQCYRELEDFKQAYFYACKLREEER